MAATRYSYIRAAAIAWCEAYAGAPMPAEAKRRIGQYCRGKQRYDQLSPYVLRTIADPYRVPFTGA